MMNRVPVPLCSILNGNLAIALGRTLPTSKLATTMGHGNGTTMPTSRLSSRLKAGLNASDRSKLFHEHIRSLAIHGRQTKQPASPSGMAAESTAATLIGHPLPFVPCVRTFILFKLSSAGCSWWLVLICCERKVLIAGWWLVLI